MPNYTGDFALFSNPKLAVEIIENLKANTDNEERERLLQALGGVTKRDLLFYSLGKCIGHQIAVDSFHLSFFGTTDEGQSHDL